MRPMFDSAKGLFERVTGARVYRNSLPHGFDLFRDLNRVEDWAADDPKVIFDIGAHVGATVARFRVAFPSAVIYAFEPASANRRELTTLAGCDPNVRIHALAVSNRNDVASLHLTEHTATHSLIQRDSAIASEEVSVVTLDAFCEQHRVEHIHFCKVDTEGNDLAVLEGAGSLLSAQRVDFVQVETSFRRDISYFSPIWEIDRLMHERQYELFGLYEQQPCWTGRNSLLYANAVYVRTSLVQAIPPW